jgi:hypothetical protein
MARLDRWRPGDKSAFCSAIPLTSVYACEGVSTWLRYGPFAPRPFGESGTFMMHPLVEFYWETSPGALMVGICYLKFYVMEGGCAGWWLREFLWLPHDLFEQVSSY